MSLANLDPALFYLVILPLAFLVVCFSTLYLLGIWNEWREEERNREADEAAERRIRQLDPLDDDWTPARWPMRRGPR